MSASREGTAQVMYVSRDEVALLGEVGTHVRHDPPERSIEPTAWPRHAASSSAGTGG
jgi:hypothetical protein